MAHVSKYSRSSVGQLFSHYDRTKNNLGDSINRNKTHLNYNLAKEDQPLSQLEFLRKRTSEIKCLNRKDVKVMCDWVITKPEDVVKSEENLFFRETYNFLKKRYGKDNVISAYVHNDEVTPHCHFSFIPVVTDKKTGNLKVSAKEKITKRDLKTFHGDLSKHLEKQLGHSVKIMTGVVKEQGGNKSIQKLKLETLQELRSNFEKTDAMHKNLMKVELTEEPKPLSNILNTVTLRKKDYNELIKTLDQVNSANALLNAEKSSLLKENENLRITLQKTKKTLNGKNRRYYNSVDKKAQKFKKEYEQKYYSEIADFQFEKIQLEDDIKKLKQENKIIIREYEETFEDSCKNSRIVEAYQYCSKLTPEEAVHAYKKHEKEKSRQIQQDKKNYNYDYNDEFEL